MYQGREFPCMQGCPEVVDLPRLSVAEYIEGQAAERFEQAQDAYLEVMQNLADGAFVLLLETGLAKSEVRQTLRLWREMGREEPEQVALRLGSEWIDRLLLPEILDDVHDPVAFSQRHYELLAAKAQVILDSAKTNAELSEASGLMMGLALYLGRGLGANPVTLAEHWIKAARRAHGALD
jgi:hypothetical protein